MRDDSYRNYERPTLEDAIRYLEHKRNPRQKVALNKDEYFICKKFFGQPKNRSISIPEIRVVDQELYEHLSGLLELGRRTVIPLRNIVLLGRNRNGKLRIAFIDVE
mgnify:CR=1 FL=1